MERFRGKWLTVILIACLMIKIVPVQAGEGNSFGEKSDGIEQVYLNLPEVFVFGSGFEKTEEVEGYLGQKKLRWVSTRQFSETEEGIYFYILLDISDSIPNSYFEKIKKGIINLQMKLNERDKIILFTFGEDVKLLADGTQTQEQLEKILGQTENRDQRTLLFEGIGRVAQVASKVQPDECKRRVLVVISDGEDIAVGQKMSQEALTELKEDGIPAYALCIQDTGRNNINSFGEFARTSGGNIETFQADQSSEILGQLYDELYSYTVMEFEAANNIVSNGNEIFSVRIPEQGATYTKEVMNLRWIPDTEAPQIINARQAGQRQIEISFSEPVDGADAVSNYLVKKGDQIIPLSSVSHDENMKNAVILSCTDVLADGDYNISCVNITDQSMEKNRLISPFTLSLSGLKTQNARAEAPGEVDYTGIWFLLFVSIVVLVIVLLVISNKNKSQNSAASEDKLDIKKAGDEKKKHVEISQMEKRSLRVIVSVEGNYPQEMEWVIEKSLIVGRADICDIYFDDPRMSRQHFSLEQKGEELFVTDLNTTNGTMVNGIRIRQRRKLNAGDIITVGSVEITLRW